MNEKELEVIDLAGSGLRATTSAYVVLVGPWLAMIALMLFAGTRAPESNAFGAGLLVAVVALVFTLWLRGYRVRVNSTTLEYRDGLYRIHTCTLSEIRTAEHLWIDFERLGRQVSAPRFVIELKNGSSIVINSKVFSRTSLQTIGSVLRENGITARDS